MGLLRQNTGVNWHLLLPGNFLTQGWNPQLLLCLLHRMQILYHRAPRKCQHIKGPSIVLQGGWSRRKQEGPFPKLCSRTVVVVKSLSVRTYRKQGLDQAMPGYAWGALVLKPS